MDRAGLLSRSFRRRGAAPPPSVASECRASAVLAHALQRLSNARTGGSRAPGAMKHPAAWPSASDIDRLAPRSRYHAMSAPFLLVDASDSVATALRDLAAGETLETFGVTVKATAAIPRGHKIAVRAVEAGGVVRKFGFPIGRATSAIAPGDHVHTHNLATALGLSADYAYAPTPPPAAAPSPLRFQGYRRGDGRVGTRNEIWVLPTVGCVARTAEKLAADARARQKDRVDGVFAFAHPFGCSQLGEDLAGTRAVLARLAAHPNAGGALIVALGCE